MCYFFEKRNTMKNGGLIRNRNRFLCSCVSYVIKKNKSLNLMYAFV